MENDPPAVGDQSPLYREMSDQGLVQFTCPAPLAENRDRFLQLIHDLQHRRDDYAGQLGHLTLAGLGSSGKMETKTSIIGALLKQTGIEEKKDQQRAMILWQARLLLKLGEIFDREQMDLQENLKRISARESGLLEELREEDEQPFSLTRDLTAADGRTDRQMRLRLKAWSRLFALGSQQSATSTFITTSRDAFLLMSDQYELNHKNPPHLLLSLQLPAGPTGNTLIEQRTAFTDDAAEPIEILQRLIEDPALINKKEHIALDGPTSRWADLLEQHYPEEQCSRCTLSLYSLPGIDPHNFFLETFGRDEDEGLKKIKDTEGTGAVIGLLTQQADR